MRTVVVALVIEAAAVAACFVVFAVLAGLSHPWLIAIDYRSV